MQNKEGLKNAENYSEHYLSQWHNMLEIIQKSFSNETINMHWERHRLISEVINII